MREVVVIEEADELTPGVVERAIGGRADAAFVCELDLHTPADSAQLFEEASRLSVGRAVVDDAPFPAGKCLAE